MTFAKNSGKGARMKRFCAAPLFAVLSLSALTGCAQDTQSSPHMFCPQVAVLQQAQTLTAFLPGHSDVASQLTTAQVTGVAGSCELEDNNQLLVKFQAGFTASNGPANNGKTLTLPFFVAIANGDDIVAKTDYTIAMPFNGNASTVQATSKPIKVELANDHASKSIQVLVGFELTPDQLSYAASHPAGP
jgi:hypothetical protein